MPRSALALRATLAAALAVVVLGVGVVPAAADDSGQTLRVELPRRVLHTVELTPLLSGSEQQVIWTIPQEAQFPESVFATLGPLGTLTIAADVAGSYSVPVQWRTIDDDAWTDATLQLEVSTVRTPVFTDRGDAPAYPPQPSDLASSQLCADVLLVGARGSGQSTADGQGYGNEIAAIRDGLTPALGDWISVREVWLAYTAAPVADIAADPFGYLASINDGIAKLTAVLQDSRTNCPDEQWVIAGYSQGALVVRDTAYDIRGFGSRFDQVILLADPGRMMGGANGNSDAGVPNWGTGDSLATGSGVAASGFVATLAGTRVIAASYRAVTVHLCDEYDSVCDNRSSSPVDGDAVHAAYISDVPRLNGWGASAAAAINALETTGVLVPVVPTIAGVPQVGATLTVTTGAWGPGTVDLAIQWFAGAVAIDGADDPTLVVPAEAVGLPITVTVSGTQPGYLPATSTSGPTSAVAPVFADVATDHFFNLQIEWMRTAGISNGYLEPDGYRTYHPNENVSRQAMAAFLYRMAGSPAFVPPAIPSFADVSPAHAFFLEIEWMRAEGITNGNPGPGGTLLYLPDDAVSRQAMSAFLYRLAGQPAFTPPTTASFADVPVGALFFLEVEWMKAQEITTGYPDGYHPLENVTRQSMAVFLYRYAH